MNGNGMSMENVHVNLTPFTILPVTSKIDLPSIYSGCQPQDKIADPSLQHNQHEFFAKVQ